MPRADEPRSSVRWSAGMFADLELWAERYGVSVGSIVQEAVAMAGEVAARRARERKVVKSSVGSGKVRRAAPVVSRPAGAASVPVGVARADAFRAIEERRRALGRAG